MKDTPHPTTKHQLEHEIPTVIHHPEEDLPILARWLSHAMENQTRFWSLLVGLVVVVVGLSVLSAGLSGGRVASDEAWTELDLAKSAADRVKVAEKYPKTQAERWALLQAATEYYNKGFADLPANRDVALPDLKKALELFDRVFDESEKTSPQALAAAFGKARTLEARNELDKAIKQYELVAKTWPDSDEAKQSTQFAETLKKPESVAFYKELYAFKPTEMSLPPMGQESISLPTGHPALDSPTIPAPGLLPPPPPSPSGTPKAEMPKDLFAPLIGAPKADAPASDAPKADMPKPEAPKTEASKPEAPKAETPKPEAPKAETPKPEAPKAEAPKPAPEAAPSSELPKDPFASDPAAPKAESAPAAPKP